MQVERKVKRKRERNVELKNASGEKGEEEEGEACGAEKV